MAVTAEELESFNRFASEKLSNGDADSITELAALWQNARERADVNAAIRQGIDEMNTGQGRPADEAMADIRQKYNFPSE